MPFPFVWQGLLPLDAARETKQDIGNASLATHLTEATFAARVNTLGQKAMVASMPVVLASDQSAVPVNGTVIGNPATAFGKTVTYVSVNQGLAGTTVIAAADAAKKHKILGMILTVSLAGTLKFTDGVADLIGPLDLGAASGLIAPAGILPYAETGAVNRALNLITTVGAARGAVIVLTE